MPAAAATYTTPSLHLRIGRATQSVHPAKALVYGASWTADGETLAVFDPNDNADSQASWTDPRSTGWVMDGSALIEESLEVETHREVVRADAIAQPDGTVLVRAADQLLDVGDWYMIERGDANEMDQAAIDASGDESYVVLESDLGVESYHGWASQPVRVETPKSRIRLEWFGAMTTQEHRGTRNVAGHMQTFRFRMNSAGSLQVVVIPETGQTQTATISGTNRIQSYGPMIGIREFGIRMDWDLITGTLVWEWTGDNGQTWEPVAELSSIVSFVDPDVSSELFMHGLPNATTPAGLDGYTRKFKLVYDNTTIMDVDVDRDTGSNVDSTSIVERGKGLALTPQVWVSGAGNVPVEDPFATYLTTKKAAPSQGRNIVLGQTLSGESGGVRIDSADLPNRLLQFGTGAARPVVEWWGTLMEPSSAGYRYIFNMWVNETGIRRFGLYLARWGGTHRVCAYGVQAGTGAKLMTALGIPLGQRIGIRVEYNSSSTTWPGMISWTEDGNVWTQAELSTFGAAANIGYLDFEGPNSTGGVAMHYDPQTSNDQPFLTESLKLIDHGDHANGRGALIDVNFGRDMQTLDDRRFIDKLGTTWTVNPDTRFHEGPQFRRLPDSQSRKLWTPIAPIRMAEVDKSTGIGHRIEFMDPAPPQGRPVVYRVRPILEPEPTFETRSHEWAETAPVTVVSDSWWMSTLDGRIRYALHPVDGVGWNTNRPAIVSSPIGQQNYEVEHDVLKGRQMPVTVETLSEDEYRQLQRISKLGEHLHVTDQHGRVGIFKIVGEIQEALITTVATEDETAPVGHTYSTSMSLVEVDDPRYFGFGI